MNNEDGTPVSIRYIEDGEESKEFLVDEVGDEEDDRSKWYGSDGTTPLGPKTCSECQQEEK
jgi:hypothetical protein